MITDIKAALAAHPALKWVVYLGLGVLAFALAVHFFSKKPGAAIGAGAKVHGHIKGRFHRGGGHNKSGGNSHARSTPAVQDVQGPQGDGMNEPFAAVVDPTGPVSSPYPSDYVTFATTDN